MTEDFLKQIVCAEQPKNIGTDNKFKFNGLFVTYTVIHNIHNHWKPCNY